MENFIFAKDVGEEMFVFCVTWGDEKEE